MSKLNHALQTQVPLKALNKLLYVDLFIEPLNANNAVTRVLGPAAKELLCFGAEAHRNSRAQIPMLWLWLPHCQVFSCSSL